MRLASIRVARPDQAVAGRQAAEEAAVITERGTVRVAEINERTGASWPTELMALLEAGLDRELFEQAGDAQALPDDGFELAPPYRRPRKIWGIGLNYLDHANDLGAPHPTEPASFIKGDHTIVGPGDEILLPQQSRRVTAEAELGVIIGRTCRNVSEQEAADYVAGVCLIIDMTAEDILQRNPRFLTRAKNFETFFSFGPELITLDEIPDLSELTVGTYRNGELHRENRVSNMAFSPFDLVAFHSSVMPLFPGDIISTGTPGAVVIEDGDMAECRIEGLGSLSNPVRRVPEA